MERCHCEGEARSNPTVIIGLLRYARNDSAPT